MSFTSASRWSDVYLAAAARAVSNCGDFLAATVLVLALQQRGAGSLAVAAVLIASALPMVLLAPVAGRLADRVDSRLLLVVSGLAQGLVCLLLAVTPGVVAIIALVAVLSCGLAVTAPTLGALTPAMVSRADLPRANAVIQTAGSVGMLAAPALGGVLMGQFGLRLPLLLDAASYLAIVIAGLAIQTRRGTTITPADLPGAALPDEMSAASPAGPSAAGDPPGRPWRLRDDRLLGGMVLLVGAVIAAVSAVNVVDVFFVRQVLHSSATGYGLIGAVWLAAMPVGGWLLSRRGLGDRGLSVAMLGMLGLTCLAVLIAGTVPALGWMVPLWVIGGITNGGENVAASVLLGRRVPAAARGHAFAIFAAVANGANAAGYLLGGVLLGVLPVRVTLAGTGLVGLLVTAGFAAPMLRAAARGRATDPVDQLAPVS